MGGEPWLLAIDFGTSYTVGALRVGDRPAEVLEVDGDRRVPSVVLVQDDATIVVGRDAEELSTSRPGRAVRASKSMLSGTAPIVLAGRPWDPARLVAAILSHVYDEAQRRRETPPAASRLTHPATWSAAQRQRLADAAVIAQLPNPVLVPEPVAAAIAHAVDVGLPPDATVAVYDLGGGTFDTATLRATPDGFIIVGRPTGDRSLGGELFDELLTGLVGSRLEPEAWWELQHAEDPRWQRAALRLRHDVRRAKELLSTQLEVDLAVALPTGVVEQRVRRADLEELIGAQLMASVELLAGAVDDAGIAQGELAAVYLAGGSSRIPMVERLVHERFPGVPISRRGDPKASVALGAALLGSRAARHASSDPHGVASAVLPPASTSTGRRGARAIALAVVLVVIAATAAAGLVLRDPSGGGASGSPSSTTAASTGAGTTVATTASSTTAAGSTTTTAAGSTTTTSAPAATIPLLEGDVGHLLGGVSASLADELEEDDLVELHLRASEQRVMAGPCAGTVSACDVLWAVSCHGDVVPGPDITRFSELVASCPQVVSLAVVDAAGEQVPAWKWLRGAYGLDGFFAVEAPGFNHGVLFLRVREIPPEDVPIASRHPRS